MFFFTPFEVHASYLSHNLNFDFSCFGTIGCEYSALWIPSSTAAALNNESVSSYVRQKTRWRLVFTPCLQMLEMMGCRNVSSSGLGNTTYLMFNLFGIFVIMSQSLISNKRTIFFRVSTLAVAVAATILVEGGSNDRISEIFANSVLNLAPLHDEMYSLFKKLQ